MSGEWFLLSNALMNSACLMAAGKACALMQVRPMRVTLAALAGAFAALYAFMLAGTAHGALVALPVGMGMAYAAFGVRGFSRCTPFLFVTGLMSAGLARLLSTQGMTMYTLAPVCALCVWLSGRTLLRARAQQAKRVMLRVGLRGKQVSFSAICDSGNLLSDPMTALPVIVAPYRALKGILPPSINPRNFLTLQRGFRIMTMQTAAGSHMIMCFRPETLLLRDGNAWHAVKAIVAISPETSMTSALAPSIIMENKGGTSCLLVNGKP